MLAASRQRHRTGAAALSNTIIKGGTAVAGANGAVTMQRRVDPFAAMQEKIADFRRRRLFFIGGMPKSGTTWLQLLLDAHPAVSCRGEGHFCDRLRPLLKSALSRHNAVLQMKNTTIFKDLEGYPGFSNAHLQFLLTAAVTLLMAEAGGGAPIVGEKTPDNLLSFPTLQAMFPAARFVIMIRDGRDCAVSSWFHNLRINPEKTRSRFAEFPDFIDTAASAWAACIDTGLSFAAANPTTCATVSYESLMAAPDATLARLFAFLGADTDAAVVRRCVEAAEFSRLSGGRAAGDEDRDSLFRRGVIGDWRQHFDAAASQAFERHAAAQLRRCGYALADQAG
jgi:hypothetical protein